jgi:hypothetical protein
MGPFEMIVLIVLIAVGGGIVSRHLKMKHDTVSKDELTRLRSDVDVLSRRVTTLERLATDPTVRLSREIEQLRDHRA